MAPAYLGRVSFYCVLQYFRDVTSLSLWFRDTRPSRVDCCCSAVMMWMNNSTDLQKLIFSIKIANRIITVGSLGAALVAPGGRFLVVEAAVMMWMNNSVDFYKTCFFQKFRQSHHHRGLSWRCFGGTVSRILCKLQHFLHVASLPLCK